MKQRIHLWQVFPADHRAALIAFSLEQWQKADFSLNGVVFKPTLKSAYRVAQKVANESGHEIWIQPRRGSGRRRVKTFFVTSDL